MEDKVVLIVGGSGGIGKASAVRFAREGASVVLAARNPGKAEATAQQINDAGGDAYVVQVDVTDLASVSTMTREVIDNLDEIDVLVNAFGTGILQPLLDIKPDDARELFDVNVYGTFLVTQTVVRHMATQKKGKVVMFPGILGKRTMKDASVYSASKYAVTGFTKALVKEFGRQDISFTLMYLGGVNTGFWENPRIDKRVQRDKMLSPEEVADAIFNAVDRDPSSVLNEVVLQPSSHQMV